MSDASWLHLIDQAERCLARGDHVGAEVHLTAALESAKVARDRGRVARALAELGRLRRAQGREAAAARLLDEAESLGGEDPAIAAIITRVRDA